MIQSTIIILILQSRKLSHREVKHLFISSRTEIRIQAVWLQVYPAQISQQQEKRGKKAIKTYASCMCICTQSPQAHGKSSHLASPWTVPQLLITVALCPLPISTPCLNLPWCACCQAVSQKASDLMASASPQRCYPQLVVKFKSATQKALCSFTRANELNQEEGHSSKYSVKEHFYRGLPFAQRSRGPPLTCEQSRQADLQPRLQGSTLTLRHTGGRASLPDSASPFLPSQTAHRVEHFILKSYW